MAFFWVGKGKKKTSHWKVSSETGCCLDQVQATLPPRSLRHSHTQVMRGVEFVIGFESTAR